MPRKHQYLKCETKYFQEVEKWIKKFELRKNDRNFQVWDIIHLQETVNGEYTGRVIGNIEIIYIFLGGSYWLDPGYCILNW